MDTKVEAAINRIQQLQQAFASNLTSRIEQLNQSVIKLDKSSSPLAQSNKQHLKEVHDLAHKLAGSAGTFQFTDVYKSAKNIESFCADISNESESKSKLSFPEDWHDQVQQLQLELTEASVNKGQIVSHKQTTAIAPSHIEGSPAKTSNIILVDDDELLSALIQEQARHFGFSIHCINNPDELSDYLEHHKPEVILMDIVFPNYAYNGIDLVKQLKANNKIPCPVIFLSNREDFNARLEAVRSGGNGYIVKPVNILELVEILDKHAHKTINNNYRALIIDDDPIVSLYYEKILELHDFKCKSVIDPLTAFELLETFSPDVILLDINMPGCNGFEIAEVIRQDNRYTHIPILFLSVENSNEHAIAAAKAGGNCLLDKQATKESFIANVLGQSKRSKELHSVIDRLREDELSFQAISHSTNDAIITLNKDGLIILWNEGAENIFGYQSIEVIGQSIEIIIPKKYQEQHRKGFHNLVTNKNKLTRRSIESQAQCKNGKLIFIELSYSEWISGSERFFTSIIRDISQRKEIEEQLHDQKENLNAIITNSAEGIITLDDKGIIEMANPKSLEIFGYDASELVGQNVSVLMPESLRPQHDQYLQEPEIHAAKIINKARESQGTRKDGSDFPMELNISPMYIAGVKKFVGMLHDITDRKNAIEIITNAKLEAEHANKAKSQFLSSMSHELRTPLNAVLGFTQLLQEDKVSPLNEDQQDSLSHVYTAGLHLLNLIDEVLDLSKIENSDIEVKFEPINLIALLDQSLQSITPQLKRAQLSLEKDLPEDQNIFVKADVFRLNQVFSNLLTNAIKYNNENGVVSVFLSSTEKKVRIHVKDTGLGIPENMMKDLFKPFNRLGAAHSGIEGTGIGLTITKMLVEMMGGSIGVDNIPGKGCTFWIELEKTDGTDKAVNEPLVNDIMNKLDTPSISILYIEDNPANCLLMKKIISSQTNFQYSEATTGTAGIEAALKIQPQIILLDINLPDMDGFEVYQQLKIKNLSKSTKIIIVSANAMPDDVAKGKGSEYFDYITKPINQNQLLETINRALK